VDQKDDIGQTEIRRGKNDRKKQSSIGRMTVFLFGALPFDSLQKIGK
jgi:hypothetical protein